MDHLEDKLGEMLAQVANDLVEVSAALRNDVSEEQPAPYDRASSSRNGGAHEMTGDDLVGWRIVNGDAGRWSGTPGEHQPVESSFSSS